MANMLDRNIKMSSNLTLTIIFTFNEYLWERYEPLYPPIMDSIVPLLSYKDGFGIR